MKSKNFIVITITFVLIVSIITASINIAVDPLYQYHIPKENELIYLTNETYQNPGVAKNFEFDTAIIGNSMCENFRASWFDKAFNAKTVKLTSAGAYCSDYTLYLDLLSKRNDTVRMIVGNFDKWIYKGPVNQAHYSLPMYLYDENIFNDVSYWLNFDIFFKCTYKTLKSRKSNQKEIFDEAYVWDDQDIFSKERVLAGYTRQSENAQIVNIESVVNNTVQNLDSLLSYVENMKETKFILFFSPYSILYWDSEYQKNCLESDKIALRIVIQKMLEHDNVEYYFWTDNEMLDIICDLDNYRDNIHYSGEVNKLMLDRFVSKDGLMTKENYEEKIDYFFDFLEAYDYDSIFE